jgi:hypothetical protein
MPKKKKYGRLTIVKARGCNEKWLFRCDCGKLHESYWYAVRDGKTTSCRCYQAEYMKKRNTTHGMSYSVEYRAYVHAKDRCVNPKCQGYKHYGGRGIKFLFKSFQEFYSVLGPRPDKLTLDRTDNDGHYEPSNVRWATRSEQLKNQRRHLKAL